MKDISYVTIESISQFIPNLGKALKRGQAQHKKNLQSQKTTKSKIIY